MKLKSFVSLSLLFLFSLVFSFQCFAWNAVGHMLIGNIAYERLQPDVRSKVDKMIADLAKDYPGIKSFYQAAPWPDLLRAQKIETFTHWHYIDIPFSADGTPLKNIMDTDNVIWAINQIEPIVANSKANPAERARFLAFLIHIVGDVHQPLHTAGRITSNNPDGDQGGNLYVIEYPTNTFRHQKANLHRLWDGGVTLFDVEPTPENIASLTQLITTLYPEKYFDAKTTDLIPEHWADEGFDLCKTFLYSTPEKHRPGADYLEKGKQVSEQRVALAGYRLANLLNKLLASN